MKNKMVENLFWSCINGETIEDRIDDTEMRKAGNELEDAISFALFEGSVLAGKPDLIFRDLNDLLKEMEKSPDMDRIIMSMGGRAKALKFMEGNEMDVITALITNYQNETGLHYFMLGYEVAKQLLTGTASVDLTPGMEVDV